MARRPFIFPFFLLSLFFAVVSPIPIVTFAPFLIITYSRYSFLGCLWTAGGCGFIIDLLSALPFGMHTFSYIVVTILLRRYSIYFVDGPLGLAALSFLFSICLSVVMKIIFSISGIPLTFNLQGLTTDFLLMPILDGIYALLFFSLPLIFYRFILRQWFRFLFFKKETKKKREEKVKTHGK